jgi:PAS domain S-box-containing protein
VAFPQERVLNADGRRVTHPNLVGGSGEPTGLHAVRGWVAVGIGAFVAIGLVVLPFVHDGVSQLPVLLVVPIVLCAVRFGFRGGIAAAAIGSSILFGWLLHGGGGADELPAFGVRAVAFVLVGGLVGSLVSERERYEVAVTAHNEMSLELICTASFKGYFTRLNPAWTDVLGWELDELMARPYADFIHPDDVKRTVPITRRTRAGLPVINFQNRYRCRDGSYRWLEWTSRSDKHAKVLYAVARDVTVRKEAEERIASFHEQLEQAVKERTAELEERTRELDDSRRETLRRLALAAEYRDDETFEHTERVGRMSAELARRLDISAEQAALLRWAAPLHDVGKLALSDTIVLKRGRLTGEEMKQVRKHPENGARILANSNSDVLQLAEQIALNHHEWWNGSGYPNGLAGEAIPQCARIVAVADVYDALTHSRPYKPAWPSQAAVDEISRLSGQQFDPRVVEAFLSLNLPDVMRELTTWAHEDADQTAANMDQTRADFRQTASDADQLVSDTDQAEADLAQHESDRDRAALSEVLGTNLALALEAWRVERDAATVKRDAATVKRDAATVERDAATVERDAATVERDAATLERDAASRERDSTEAVRSRTPT